MARSGIALLVTGPLPPVCLKCAGSADVRGVVRRFAVVGDGGAAGDVADAAALLSDAAGATLGVAGFLRVLATTREAEVEIPICARCERLWARARSVHRAALLSGIVGLLCATVVLAAGPRLSGGGLVLAVVGYTVGALLAVRVIPSFIERGMLARAGLSARRIDERGVVLVGVAPRWVDAVEAYRGSARGR